MSLKQEGLIQCYTGNGKGKTTSAIGVVLRSLAVNKKVAIIAFDKGGNSHYSERLIFQKKFPELDFYPTGLDRIDPQTGRFRMGITQEDKQEGQRGLTILQKLFQKDEYDLIILDEINSSTDLGIVDKDFVLKILKNKPSKTEIILTGRNAPQEFIDLADLVTEMCLKKHYFYQGVSARAGIDY